MVRRIHLCVEPSAVRVKIYHPPIKQQQHAHQQPNGHSLASHSGLRRFWRRRHGCLRCHFAEIVAALGTSTTGCVPGAAGAFVAGGGAAGAVIGVTKMGASALKLTKYSATARASGFGTIS